MILRTLLVIAAITSSLPVTSQSALLKPLRKGDLLPDITVDILKGDSVYKARTGDFKGKYLLLDFWQINCVDCIAGLPHMLELNQKFGNKFRVIVVTRHSKEEILRLWERFEKKSVVPDWVTAGKQLPFIVNDSVLSSLFPHQSFPTHVWITEEQSLYAKAYNTSTTLGNVKMLLDKESPLLDEQADLALDPQNPLSWLRTDLDMESSMQYYSFMTNYLEFGAAGYILAHWMTDSATRKKTGVACMNKSILDLYKEAYADDLPIKPYIPDNRVIIENLDLRKLIPPADMTAYYRWAKKNTFCYGLKVPASQSGNLHPIFKSDLDRHFGIKSELKFRKVKCWVLKRVASLDKLKSKTQKERNEKANSNFIIEHLPFSALFTGLGDYTSALVPGLPFINQVKYSHKIDITLPWSDTKIPIRLSTMRKALRKFGLDLVVEYTDIEMLVIKSAGTKN